MSLTIEEMARIIVDKEIPLLLRMGPPDEYAEDIKLALAAGQQDDYLGLDYDQVVAKLRENARQAK
jgi:hypothetical protein